MYGGILFSRNKESRKYAGGAELSVSFLLLHLNTVDVMYYSRMTVRSHSRRQGGWYAAGQLTQSNTISCLPHTKHHGVWTDGAFLVGVVFWKTNFCSQNKFVLHTAAQRSRSR